MPDQPTILVKKADGTLVRMTLNEVRKLKDDKKLTKKSASGAALTSSLHSNLSVEEDLPPALEHLPRTSPSRDSEAEEVLKRLKFSPPSEHQNRLRTIIQLYLKDVRSAEQAQEILSRSGQAGGVGLSAEESRMVIQTADEVRKEHSLVVIHTAVPAVIRPVGLPATATPFNAFVHSTPSTQAVPQKTASSHQSGSPAVSAANLSPQALPSSTAANFSLRSPVHHTVMHDITAPPEALGPVDEIAYLTLTDFRRLASTPEEAALRLKQKFINLHQESILLYLEALEAWHASPLYHSYVTSALEYLARGQKLTTAVVDKKNIQLSEMKALVSMERELKL